MSLVAIAIALGLVFMIARDRPNRTPVALAEPAAALPEVPSFAERETGGSPPQAEPQPVPQPTAEREAEPVGNPVVWVKKGERVILRDEPGGKRIAAVGDETTFGSPSVFSVVRHTNQWIAAPSPLVPNGELAWMRADPAKLFGGDVDFSIHVDLSERRAKLIRSGNTIMRWPVTVGAAGTETPTGTFAVTDTFRGGLNPAYGCCAVALTATQPNLPPDWPGGDRIAFHGTDGSLGEATSTGCLRSADEDVSKLVDTVPLGTPVRIVP